jgi:mannose-6-phosphate isomerase
MIYPVTFRPIFKERIWGGRELERLYQKAIPFGKKIGESWELSDRNDNVSVILNGDLAGTTLRSLMESGSEEVLGKSKSLAGRFPLLCKLLDAREKLSLQVHPPEACAKALGGEAKTEIWYVAHAEPRAELYAGLKSGVTKGVFESQLKAGCVAECFHSLQVKAGDVLFVPSGRVHGLGRLAYRAGIAMH